MSLKGVLFKKVIVKKWLKCSLEIPASWPLQQLSVPKSRACYYGDIHNYLQKQNHYIII